MEIILSKQCESLTGSLGRGFGYHIQGRTDLDGKKRFWGVRNANGEIPANGHLRFIFACAKLAQQKLHIADIRISAKEFRRAADEAQSLYGDVLVMAKPSRIYNASDVLFFKRRWSL